MEIGDSLGGCAEEGDLEFGGVQMEDGFQLARWEGRLLHSWFRRDEELLVFAWDVQLGLYRCGEVL